MSQPAIYTTGTFFNRPVSSLGWWGTIQCWDEDLDHILGYNFRFEISGITAANEVTIGQCISSSPNGLFLANGGAVKGNSSATNPNTAF